MKIQLQDKHRAYSPYVNKNKVSFISMEGTRCAPYITDCKEQFASDTIRRKSTAVAVRMSRRLTSVEIRKLRRYLHWRENRYGIKRRTKILRVEDRPNWLYFSFSSKWTCNSVALTLYATFIRKFIHEALKSEKTTDQKHLESAKWVVRTLGKKGFAIFGKRHQRYDMGIVQLSNIIQKYGHLDPKHKVPEMPYWRGWESYEAHKKRLMEWQKKYQCDMYQKFKDKPGYMKLLSAYRAELAKK